MFCAISGVAPEEPVVSVKSGLLFERRLIEKAIQATGQCPITGEALSSSDLVAVTGSGVGSAKGGVRPAGAGSIPLVLGMLQSEWDALVLRDFQLEQQLATAREELSYSLFQSDAAARVIARLMRERDEARQLLAAAERQLAAVGGAPGSADDLESAANGKRERAAEAVEAVSVADAGSEASKRAKQGLSPDVIAELSECNAQLSALRKKRQVSSGLCSVEQLAAFTQLSSQPVHKTTKPGILGLDIHPSKPLIVSAGMDGAAVIVDRSSSQITATLSGHSKRVTAVKFVAAKNMVLTASADKSVRMWSAGEDDSYESRLTLTHHTAEVRGVSVHPTSNYFVTVSADKSWALCSTDTGSLLAHVPAEEASTLEGYSCCSFHPDGLILGTGNQDSVVRIWDVKSQSNVAKFEGHTGSVSSLSFSENGYFLATAGMDGVKLWDLRKLKNFRSFSPYEAGVNTNTVEFDYSGAYLAMGGSDIRVFQVGSVKSEWSVVNTYPDLSGTGKITALKFGPDAQYLAVGTTDRNLRVFGAPAAQEESMDE